MLASMSLRGRLLTMSAWLLLGCSGTSSSSTSPRPTSPPEPEVRAPLSPPATTPTPFPTTEGVSVSDSTSPPAERATPAAQRALREARALARSERFEEAWQRLAPWVQDGSPAALRCEAGYLAHRAGHTNDALPLVRGASEDYPRATDPEARAAQARCFYNVGLVSEAAGDLPAAVAAYQRSLSLRANRTVYKHLVAASLRADGALDEAEAGRIGAIVRRAVGPSASFDALASALTEYCSAQRYHPQDCIARVEQRWAAPAGTSSVLEVATIASIDPNERYLAVRDASGARLVAALAPRGARPEETRIQSVRFEEILDALGAEIVLDVEDVIDDSYPGGNDCSSEERGCDRRHSS